VLEIENKNICFMMLIISAIEGTHLPDSMYKYPTYVEKPLKKIPINSKLD
jgi:hypothetical protein